MDDRWRDNAGVWQGYCTAGGSIDEQQRRLAEVPEHLHEQVRGHLRTLYAVSWQGYVLAGRDKRVRRSRLDKAPASLRPAIEARLRARGG